jgi:trimethylamine:corrinoid methyltransferase-like protein
MLAKAQPVAPGTPVIACPIIFSTDMRTGRSLQSSAEAMRCAAGAVQFIRTAFDLPTHCYGTGADSPIPDAQSMSERALLSMLMGTSGLDILGGAGQLETATAVSPLQLIIDNEVLGMVRRTVSDVTVDGDQMAWELMTKTMPGDHFLMSDHTVKHCREGLDPINFVRLARDSWERVGSTDLMDRVLGNYRDLIERDNPCLLDAAASAAVDEIVEAGRKALAS